jgi:DNA polymerase III subunit gamma/tau
MAYQALYRRYRPRRFSELKGQEHVVRTLRNAVREDRVGHAYLFSGPRGTGKTTTARILAKVLNCEAPVDGEPCCACDSCKAVEGGSSFDVIELDAASNNGVENIRDLIEKASRTSPGRRKVYILDEVHMLSKGAEAALLKTLEEPPGHVVFVLATTDPHKVNETIRSRCQSIDFHLLPQDELLAHVRWVAADAGLEVDDRTIEAVLRQGRGSARDTLSALDAAVAGGGLVGDDEGVLDEVIESLIHRDAGRGVAAVASAIASGRDARILAEQVVGRLRDAFLALVAPELVALPAETAAKVGDQAHRLGAPGTVRAIEALGQLLVDVRNAPDPRLLLDVTIVRLTRDDVDRSVDALLERLERLERQVASGAVAPASAAAPQPAPLPTSASGRALLGSRVRPSEPAEAPPEAPAAVAPTASSAAAPAVAASVTRG